MEVLVLLAAVAAEWPLPLVLAGASPLPLLAAGGGAVDVGPLELSKEGFSCKRPCNGQCLCSVKFVTPCAAAAKCPDNATNMRGVRRNVPVSRPCSSSKKCMPAGTTQS